MKKVIKENSDKLDEARGKCLAVLKMILGGDQVAAEYVLLGLLSYVNVRESGMLLGNIGINVSNMTEKKAQNLSKFIKHITPLTCLFNTTT